MNLIDLTNDYLKVKEMAENGEIPFEAVADTLDGLEGEFDGKADGIASLVKRLTAEAGAIKSEEDNLYKRRKAKENAAERLKSYLLGQMTQIGLRMKRRFTQSARTCLLRRSQRPTRTRSKRC